MFRLLSRLVCTTSGFIYPTYASYKAIKANDSQKLEVWLMYWAVMGTVMALESTVEWIFAWFPFYYECKTIVILWLTLPQIQGSTYIYVAHLHPFLSDHESDIDAALADAKVRAKQVGLEWLNKAVQRVRQAVVGSLVPQLLDEQGGGAAGTASGANGQQAQRLPEPAPGATAQLYSLAGNVLRTYGPTALAAGNALLHPMNGRAQSVRVAPSSSSPSSSSPAHTPLGRDSEKERLLVESFAERTRTESFVSGRSVSLTTAQARTDVPNSNLSSRRFESLASSSGPSTPSSVGSGTAPFRPSSYHPRSVSAGPYPASLSVGGGIDRSRPTTLYDPPVPRDPVASRIERSLYGFEEINSEDVGDYPPVSAAAMDPGQLSPGGTRRASWWWWSGDGQAQAQAQASAQAKKNA